MDSLIMLNPTKNEKALTKDMPEQVAIGYIKAKRAKEGVPEQDSASNLGDLFGGIFGNG